MPPIDTFSFLEKMIMLSKVPLFCMLAPSELRQVVEISKELSVRMGEHIVEQGEALSHLYVVHSGKFLFCLDDNLDEKEEMFLSVGDCIGDIAIFSPQYASPARIEAVENSVLLSFSREDLYDILQNNPSMAIALVEIFASRLGKRGL